MKPVKKFETFEALKAHEPATLSADKILKNHIIFNRLVKELVSAKKQIHGITPGTTY